MIKEKIKQLESLVAKLEAYDTDLDESFSLYEKGQKILSELNEYFSDKDQKLKNSD